MGQRGKWIAFFTGILLVGLGFRIIPVLGYGTLHHEIHWMVYGYDRVWYHNRTYLNPSKEFTYAQVDQQFGEGQKLVPTGEKVIGLAVYDTPKDIAIQKQKHVVSTLLILKKSNGNFIIYSLSGGP